MTKQQNMAGQLTVDGSELVPLTVEEQSLVITALVALRSSLDDAGFTEADHRLPGEVTALANRLARALR